MSAKRNRESHAAQPDHDHLDNLLDQALADSFPASDPVAIDFTAPTKRARAKSADNELQSLTNLTPGSCSPSS